MKPKAYKTTIISVFLFFVVLIPVVLLLYQRIFRKPPLPVQVKAKVAIVLDDWGYNKEDLQLLSEIKRPLTLAILPHLPYSLEVAQEAKQAGYETLLHLPLEAKRKVSAEKDTLYCKMRESQLKQRLKILLSSVPGVSGVNNHQGSKATENYKMMRLILDRVKEEQLFFMDSFTNSRSVCPKVAQELGIKFAQNNIFLDLPSFHLSEEQLQVYIRNRLRKLARIARKNGSAIGIGHDRRSTLLALKETIPLLELNGIELVYLSELIK